MSETLPKLARVKLREELLAEFERVVDEVSDAVDAAAAGRVIRDSEEKARDALDRFRQVAYERALQGKVDAASAAFPPSGESSDGATQAAAACEARIGLRVQGLQGGLSV